jgi:hypothetical protein
VGGVILESNPTWEFCGVPVFTIEVFCGGDVPAGPRFPGRGVEAIDTCGMEREDGGTIELLFMMMPSARFHHSAQVTG